jgi:hypothetical protein
VAAVGRAAYNFAYLEWGIVWLAETMEPGFVAAVGSLTAGQIADRFEQFVNRIANTDPDLPRLKALAASFFDLVDDRNALVHGRPYTAQGDEQRLLYNGRKGRRDWTIEDIIEAARSFEKAAIEAGNLLHNGRLRAYQQATGRALPL